MVETARGQTAALIGASAREIVFTSGATESCNLAIKGVARMNRDRGHHIVVSAVEHKAVLEPCKRLEQEGFELTMLRPDVFGGISARQVGEAVTRQTVLVCAMMANNVVGTVNPVEEIGQVCRRRGVLFFCDATQALGKLAVSVERVHADLMALSAHKICGPKGIGALYVRGKSPRVRLAAQIDGGGQEHFLRSGTLNVPGIVGLGAACHFCAEELGGRPALSSELRERLETGLLSAAPDAQVHGHPTQRLPNTVNISFRGIEAATLLRRMPDIAVSAGSACESGTSGSSYVLRAMGVGDDPATGAIRFSLGRFTTVQEIDYVVEQVSRCVAELRSQKRQESIT